MQTTTTSAAPLCGRKLSYPAAIDAQLVQYVMQEQKGGVILSPDMLRREALQLIQPYCHEFKASTGWLDKFLARHKLSLHPSKNLHLQGGWCSLIPFSISARSLNEKSWYRQPHAQFFRDVILRFFLWASGTMNGNQRLALYTRSLHLSCLLQIAGNKWNFLLLKNVSITTTGIRCF